MHYEPFNDGHQMNPLDFAATPTELRQHAALFWPADLIAKEASASIVPLLLETQDKFISLLDIADAHPAAWKQALQTTSGLSANVFLKHLMVLADVGGEQIKRLRPELIGLFPSGTMTYVWREQSYTYTFQSLLRPKTVDNKSLFIDGKGLPTPHLLDGAMEDVAMLLMHGGAMTGISLPSPLDEKCSIGSLLGHNDELTRFVKQRYILVSRITGGATANALGQLAQSFVRDTLAEALPQWKITRNGTVPGISHNAGKTDMGFDVVAKSPLGKYVAVEVMFQVTTNSVIERKAGWVYA